MMLPRLLLAMAFVLIYTGVAAAQLGPVAGTYNMEWSILHTPVSSDLPDLQDGTSQITLETGTGGICPPTSAFVVRNAPASSVEGGTTTWCIKSDGSFDTSAFQSTGLWNQYTSTVAIIEEDNRRGNDHLQAVARLVTAPPPPTGSLKVFITQPHNGDTVGGTVWVVMWVEGATGTSRVFSLSVDGNPISSQNAGSSNGPVTIPWDSRSAPNGTHTIKGGVTDGAQGGITNINVTVRN